MKTLSNMLNMNEHVVCVCKTTKSLALCTLDSVNLEYFCKNFYFRETSKFCENKSREMAKPLCRLLMSGTLYINIWAATRDFQQFSMCDQLRFRPACAYAQSDQSLCLSLEYTMNSKLLTEHHWEFLSLKGDCIGLAESIQSLFLSQNAILLQITCRGLIEAPC